jgi:ribosomal silencing factor RsfS
MNYWEVIQKVYEEKFGTPPKILDYIATQQILKLCCTGLSNKKIAEYLEIDIEDVENTLFEFLNFEGWENDLDINPLHIFEKVKNLDNFIIFMVKSSMISEKIANNFYEVCKKYKLIEEEVDNYYDESTRF